MLLLLSQPLTLRAQQAPMPQSKIRRTSAATSSGHSFRRVSQQSDEAEVIEELPTEIAPETPVPDAPVPNPPSPSGTIFDEQAPSEFSAPPMRVMTPRPSPGGPSFGGPVNRGGVQMGQPQPMPLQPIQSHPVPGTTMMPMNSPFIPSPDGPGIPVGSQNERRWSFNFQQAPWLVVLRSFAKDAGCSLQVATEPEGEFTYFDENLYNATEVIDLFNDHLLTSGRILIRDGSRLTLANATADIPSNMIPFVSIQQIDGLGRNELASVAIPLRNTDPTLAVQEIQQLQSQLGQVKALTNSGRVIVTDTGSYLRRMRDLLLGSGVAAGDGHAYVYQLRHAQAEDVAKAITEFLNQSGIGGGGAPDASGGVSSFGGSSDSSQRVVAEKTTNSLLVRGSSEEMATIQRLIEELDRAPREVLVQALLVEVELGNTNELGVELGLQDSVLFDRGVVDKIVTISQTTTAPNGTQTTNQNIISQTAAPGFNFNNQPLGNNIAANPSRVGSQGLSNFGVGRVNGDLGFGGLVLSAGSESVNVLLRALDANFNIDILSRPQVRAVENHEAKIQIGQQVPVVDGVAVTPVGSANPVIRQDQAGIILKVTPRISPDGRVQLDVNAEKSRFNLTPGTGVPIFTDATNGNVIEAPIKDITMADTTVSIQSGQTIVLGGMITNDQMVVVRKVPWLGDIPLIGRLFRYDLNQHKRKELLVFLTPVVLEDDGHAEYLKGREAGLIHMPSTAFSFGDNLTGTYSETLDANGVSPVPMDGNDVNGEQTDGGQFVEPTPMDGELSPASFGTSDGSKSTKVKPASETKSKPWSIMPSSGIRRVSATRDPKSGQVQQTEAEFDSSQLDRNGRPRMQNGNSIEPDDVTNGGVRPAGASSAEAEEKSSKPFWKRSPNFRGFGRKREEPVEESASQDVQAPKPALRPVRPEYQPSASGATQSPRTFPQAQLSPEVLQYHQSRNAATRR